MLHVTVARPPSPLSPPLPTKENYHQKQPPSAGRLPAHHRSSSAAQLPAIATSLVRLQPRRGAGILPSPSSCAGPLPRRISIPFSSLTLSPFLSPCCARPSPPTSRPSATTVSHSLSAQSARHRQNGFLLALRRAFPSTRNDISLCRRHHSVLTPPRAPTPPPPPSKRPSPRSPPRSPARRRPSTRRAPPPAASRCCSCSTSASRGSSTPSCSSPSSSTGTWARPSGLAWLAVRSCTYPLPSPTSSTGPRHN